MAFDWRIGAAVAAIAAATVMTGGAAGAAAAGAGASGAGAAGAGAAAGGAAAGGAAAGTAAGTAGATAGTAATTAGAGAGTVAATTGTAGSTAAVAGTTATTGSATTVGSSYGLNVVGSTAGSTAGSTVGATAGTTAAEAGTTVGSTAATEGYASIGTQGVTQATSTPTQQVLVSEGTVGQAPVYELSGGTTPVNGGAGTESAGVMDWMGLNSEGVGKSAARGAAQGAYNAEQENEANQRGAREYFKKKNKANINNTVSNVGFEGFGKSMMQEEMQGHDYMGNLTTQYQDTFNSKKFLGL